MSVTAISTLSAGTVTVPYMVMTVPFVECAAPILEAEFDHCEVPGGVALWKSNGFYSPGLCFEGYQPECTQTSMRDDAWPLDQNETAVRCVPAGFNCNEPNGNPMFATTEYDGTTLSAPAFEIRWRSEDLMTGEEEIPWPTQWFSTGKEVPPRPTTIATSPRPESPSPPPITTTPTQTHSAAFPTEQTEDPSASISTESVAGIAAGVSLGILLIGLAAVSFALRRHRQKQSPKPLPIPLVHEHRHDCDPNWAVSSNLPPIELPENVAPCQLHSEPVSPVTPVTPVTPAVPTWPVRGVDREVVVFNEVALEAPGDEQFRFPRGVRLGPLETISETSEESNDPRK